MKNVKLAVFYSFLIATLLATGCNTVQGVGQDLESVGKKTTEVAHKASK